MLVLLNCINTSTRNLFFVVIIIVVVFVEDVCYCNHFPPFCVPKYVIWSATKYHSSGISTFIYRSYKIPKFQPFQYVVQSRYFITKRYRSVGNISGFVFGRFEDQISGRWPSVLKFYWFSSFPPMNAGIMWSVSTMNTSSYTIFT